jgi:tetratricopeptide (TPR) repeat protein
MIISSLLLALLAGTAVSAGGQATDFLPGQVVPSVETGVDPSQSYALYLPSSYTPQRPAPILYCFEPRSRGLLCLELFREAAERFGYIIASSNNSLSDGPLELNVAAMMSMWHDTHARFAIDDRRTYAAGFSGGARIGNIMGQQLGFAGVIAVGAGFPLSSPPRKDFQFGFFGLIGNLDFNYYELRELDRELDSLGIIHRIEAFDGEHEWAPAERCTEAVEWMELLAMRRGLRPVDASFVGELWARWYEEAVALEREGRFYDAWRKYSAIAREFEELLDVSPSAAAAARLAATKGYRRKRKERRKWDDWSFAYLERSAAVVERLKDTSMPPPSPAELHSALHLTDVISKAAKLSTEDGRAARRVLESLYVQMSYYLVQDFLATEDYSRAWLCLNIATEIKPDRIGPWYNLACTQARRGEPKKALASLKRAVDNGFSDAEQLRNDPDLVSIRDTAEFRQLLDSLSP